MVSIAVGIIPQTGTIQGTYTTESTALFFNNYPLIILHNCEQWGGVWRNVCMYVRPDSTNFV